MKTHTLRGGDDWTAQMIDLTDASPQTFIWFVRAHATDERRCGAERSLQSAYVGAHSCLIGLGLDPSVAEWPAVQ